MATAEQETIYRNLITLDQPIEVWTPDGSYTAPRHIDPDKMPVSQTLPQAITEARKRTPRQRILTSGEWHRIREYARTHLKELERDMITGPYERTSTILDYEHGKKRKKYFSGLLIQNPETDEDGNLATDEKGIIKARNTWEMALPIESDYINKMTNDLDIFWNTIYGREDAREKLSDYASFWANPEGLRNLLRGRWLWRCRETRRVYVNGGWGPLNSYEGVASRAAADSRVVYELTDAEYEASLELLEKIKDTPARNIEMAVNGVKNLLSKARIREED